MVKKMHRINSNKKTGAPLSGTAQDSTQQIWLAGLGAFSKAQEKGSKIFEMLVKEGLALQQKTQMAAEKNLSQATRQLSDMAWNIQTQTPYAKDKLETIFEDRVAKALDKLGMPTGQEMKDWVVRLNQLDTRLQQMSGMSTVVPPLEAASSRTRPVVKKAVKPVRTKAANASIEKTVAPRVKPVKKPVRVKPVKESRSDSDFDQTDQ